MSFNTDFNDIYIIYSPIVNIGNGIQSGGPLCVKNKMHMPIVIAFNNQETGQKFKEALELMGDVIRYNDYGNKKYPSKKTKIEYAVLFNDELCNKYLETRKINYKEYIIRLK